eukprot:Nk52_evm43s1524 gene=Nk52_evmTU43s1524
MQSGRGEEAGVQRSGNSFRLHNGISMPSFGLGTYQMSGDCVMRVIPEALELGYRLIDTAQVYRNEEYVGRAIKAAINSRRIRRGTAGGGIKKRKRKDLEEEEGGQGRDVFITREDVFVTTKIEPRNQGKGKAGESIQASLKRLGLDYIDLLLVHWPGVTKMKPGDPRTAQWRRETWEAMEAAYDEGLVRAIGVSNYTVGHLRELLSYCRVRPMVNQSECHVGLDQSLLRRECAREGVLFESYSTLGTGYLLGKKKGEEEEVQDTGYYEGLSRYVHEEVMPCCGRMMKKEKGRKGSGLAAEAESVSLAQVLLRWAVQQDIVVIPKASSEARLAENLKAMIRTTPTEEETEDEEGNGLFHLCEKHLLGFRKFNRDKHYCWDPNTVYVEEKYRSF